MKFNALLALAAAVAIAAALINLHAAYSGVDMQQVTIGEIPATIYRPLGGGAAPVIVIAHGFAGSQQLMQSFALTFARNGYIAVTFDFPGHGRNPQPLNGSITDVNGATRYLLDALAQVATYARPLGDGRLALLGHSMATDIVVRYANVTPAVAATIAVSMYSPAVTASSPHNLLVIVGDWESTLKHEALRAVGLATSSPPRAGTTYGQPALGNARRAAFSPHVEHVSVLYSRTSMREALAWVDQVFAVHRDAPPVLDGRGPWILTLLVAVVALARPLAQLLPRLAAPPAGAGRGWRTLWIPLILPPIITPLLLRLLPTHFLPVLVGDYLSVHFAAYGIATLLCLRLTRPPPARPDMAAAGRGSAPVAGGPVAGGGSARASIAWVVLAIVAVLAYAAIAVGWSIDAFVTSFFPVLQRLLLILAMLLGTLLFFLSDEWLTRGVGAARGAYAVSKILFVMSLTAAVALDPYRLFFLIIIVPVIVPFLAVFGLWSGWIYRRTGQPLVAGIVNALIFAWAIGSTFPLVAG